MSRRTGYYLDGYAHQNPVPVASRIGAHLYSGVITGRDPHTKEMPESMAAQCANLFGHVRELMRITGATTDDIVKMTFYLRHYRDREALNAEWVAMFPDSANRPARQVMAAELDGLTLLQADLVAILGESGA